MANTATLLDTLQTGVGGSGAVKIYSINIDTTNTDLTVFTPTRTTERFYILGQMFSETNAPTVTYISQSGNLAGTVATTGTTAVVGTGTSFTTDFLSGGPAFTFVGSSGDSIAVASVTDDTHLTLASSSGFTASGQTYKRRMTIFAPELTSNQGIYDKVLNGYSLCGRLGDSLIVRASAAIGTNNWLMYVAQSFTDLNLR